MRSKNYIRPVEYIYKGIQDAPDLPISELVTYMKTEFKAKFEAEEDYEYRDYFSEYRKLVREQKQYGKVAKQTPMRCMTGDDADLRYAFQCQECGTILIERHDEQECVDFDLVCPICNEIELEKFPFKAIMKGTYHWINEMRMAKLMEELNAEWEAEGKSSYSVGNYTPCKFKPTKLMDLKFWFWMRYMNIKPKLKRIFKKNNEM